MEFDESWYQSKFIQKAVIWYGLFQLSHVIFNGLFLLNMLPTTFPFPPPEGWNPQASKWFTALATFDFVNALVTLIFVYAYFKKKNWNFGLGLIVATVSIYASLVFLQATITAGAWTPENIINNLVLYILFIPVIILYIQMIRLLFKSPIQKTPN